MNNSIQQPNRYSTVQVKATLYHLNGQTSEMTFNIPKYSHWSEFAEVAWHHVRDCVFHMAAHWVQISHFDLNTYVYTRDGEVVKTFFSKTIEIPLGKVYDAGTREWVSKGDAVALHRQHAGMPM